VYSDIFLAKNKNPMDSDPTNQTITLYDQLSSIVECASQKKEVVECLEIPTKFRWTEHALRFYVIGCIWCAMIPALFLLKNDDFTPMDSITGPCAKIMWYWQLENRIRGIIIYYTTIHLPREVVARTVASICAAPARWPAPYSAHELYSSRL
jgi:hypothetical protein